MKKLNIEKADKTKEQVMMYEYGDAYPLPGPEHIRLVSKKSYKRGREKIEYYNCSAAFDIEATTTGSVGHDPYGFMYVWMFCIDGKVLCGHTWDEVVEFFRALSEKLKLSYTKRLVIYCHYLSYEFFWLKDYFQFVEVFAKDPHKIMKALTADGIEFRCSYFLSNMSLAKFCENQGALFYKRSGEEFNYRVKRYPHTKQSKKELIYEYCDVRGLCECIDALLLDDTIATIPLTNTGYVRRDFKKVMLTKKNIQIFKETALDLHLYELAKDAFRGGDTHANREHIGRLIKGVESKDIESSYPYIMLFCTFPMGAFKKINHKKIKTQSELMLYLDGYACLIDVSLHQIETNSPSPYIDFGHVLEKKGLTLDNGRIIEAEYVRVRCTEVDLKIILHDYDIDSYTINELYITKKAHLPIEYRHQILEYAVKKTGLKGMDGKEYEYMKSKNRLNSSFGFMVSDICRDEWVYRDETKSFGDKPVPCDKKAALADYYDKRGNFLVYQWGVWVTTYARKRLRDFIDVAAQAHLYNDTDAVKYRKGVCDDAINAFIEKENAKIVAQWEEAIAVDPLFDIRDKDGKKHYLGIWDYDGEYEEFKTYGAKKYAVKYAEGTKDFKKHKDSGGIVVTVSGLNKQNASVEVFQNGGIDAYFKRATTFQKSGRTVSYYNQDSVHKKMLGGHAYTVASNIAVLDTTYTLGIGREFDKFLQSIGLDIY